jgi:threonine dehydrogenase-like Zn-dependent dehydrogenase
LAKVADLGFLAIHVNEGDVADQLESHWGTREIDIVIDSSGAVEAVQRGVSLLKRGGHLTALGIYSKPLALDLTRLVRAGVTLHTSYTSAWKHYEQSLQLIASGQLKVKPLINLYAFEEGIRAFEDGLAKIAIKPVLQL